MGVSWVYRLSKEQLVEELQRYQVDAEGSLAVLRQRMVTFVRTNPGKFDDKPADPPEYKEDPDRTRDLEQLEAELQRVQQQLVASSPNQTRRSDPPVAPSGNTENFSIETNIGRTLDQMRKWNCHFDGRGVYEFLERVKELQRAYQLTDQRLLQGLPELLRGDAQLWYRNCADSITTWEDFETNLRNFYLSPGELRHLDQQIHQRHQGSTEGVRAYATSLLTLMRRRGGFEPERTMETLYYNMRPEFRLLIRRTEVRTPNDLIQRVEELEEVQKEMLETSRDEARSRPKQGKAIAAAESTYVREECCWRCRQRGHSRFECRNKGKKFCSWCGKEGVLTSHCSCPRSGNAGGAGKTNEARPESTKQETPGPSSQ